MSLQLMWVAAHLPADTVDAYQKLALMQICDMSNDDGYTGEPSVAGVAAWTGVPPKRAARIVAELATKGLLERVRTRGAGAEVADEYRVFPQGVPAVVMDGGAW
ncbi:hypothetical protein BIV25_13380 [Streptomyces sp. MUSC 14]|uniref:helix-turn-helix domain-containing protein n=1 Tax=Streptomyces sp. MUSC 14 TaxID=1354889 RepID=UPI0008F56598|nr:helix-turn-helix domain-containing protein [Streptomyces sp. MUSC 14]OIJ97793.1 hypothetical protein BIV25_13380 [Streptomyces sp. MUSC 14]